MSSQRKPSEEDSKTYDQSVVIHDDVEITTTSVTMDELLTTRSVPYTTYTNNSKPSANSTNRPISANNSNKNMHKMHGRQQSVGNLVPMRYLNQAPSLIALLDVQKSRSSKINIVPITTFNASKSVPDMKNDNNVDQSPTLESDGTLDIDDFNTPIVNTKSRESIDKSMDNTMKLVDHASNDSMIIKDDKQIEYEQLIADNMVEHNDEMVDMQLLAVKAAQEFTVLANENDALLKENMAIQARYDDMQHDKEKLLNELTNIKNKYEHNTDLINDIDILKSKANQWEIEKKLLMEQIQETNITRKQRGRGSSSSINGTINKLKLKNNTSEDAHTLMMESLAQITHEKNELETMMEMEKLMKREYEKTISNLKRELKDKELEGTRLGNALDKQQQLYVSLKQNAKKKELEIDTIVGRNRNMTLEQEQQEQQQKEEVLNQLAQKTAYIQHLEQENQTLMAAKIKDDDQMFTELRQLRGHGFQRSMQFDAMSNLASSDGGHTHSRDVTYSESGFGIFTHQSNADLGLKTARTQINLFSIEDFDNIEEEDVIIDMELPQPNATNDNETIVKKKVSFLVPNKTADGMKEKRRKREEMFKINAEIEFFLMTCIAVKQNLVEEYPDSPEVMTENPMQLFEDAQKDHVIMNKFNLWIEYKLREKYDLPKIEGFQKILEKYHVKENFKKGIKKTKKGTKKLAKKTEKASIQAGHYIAEKAEEIGARIRAYSQQTKQGNENNDTFDNKEENDTIHEENENENDENKDNQQPLVHNDNDKTNTIEQNTNGNNTDNKQCCIIM